MSFFSFLGENFVFGSDLTPERGSQVYEEAALPRMSADELDHLVVTAFASKGNIVV